MAKKIVLIASSVIIMLSLLIGCTQEKKPDYSIDINEKAKIIAAADAQMAANKFDEAAVAYQKALTELTALKQKIPAGDPSLASLDTMINAAKAKLDKIPAAKKEYEAKIAAETKKPEVVAETKPEVKPEAKPAAKPKAKVVPVKKAPVKAESETKPEVKTEVKNEPQTKAQETVVPPQKKEPVKWKVVARSQLPTGEAEWHILCGESITRIVRQDPKKEKPYMAGYGGKWYGDRDEAFSAVCNQ